VVAAGQCGARARRRNPVSELSAADRAETARWQRRSLGVGLAALAVCALGALADPGQFFRAYLTAYLFFLGIGLGSMAILMIYHLTGGAWGFLIRRVLEAGMRTLPLLALLFLPIAFGLAYLYPWARPELVAASKELQHKTFYLAPRLFWLRAAAYFVLWLGLAWCFSAWSRREDRDAEARLSWRYVKLSGLGAVLYGVSIHFAAVDWLMSLHPVFHSTIFGPLVALGQLLSAQAFALVVLAWLAARAPVDEVISRKAMRDLGSLLLVFTVTWAYLVWFQYMLVWIANLRVDVIWFLPRGSGGWLWVAWAIFLLHFVVPFFLLLMRPVKESPIAVAWVAGLLLVMQLVFMNYQVLPAFEGGYVHQHWMDLILPLGIGGIWLAWFLRKLGGWPVLAEHDANREAALYLRELDLEEAAREEAIAHG
jgi:hypothetical protein